MSEPLGIGFVGAGIVGQYAHIANYAGLRDARIVALAEIRPRLRAAVAEWYEIPATYATHEELLADPRVDAIVVVTRRPATGAVVLDALRAGKHVLSEKPMAYTVEQGERLVRAAAAGGLTYAVGYMKRHDAGVEEARAVLAEQCAHGPLRSVRAYGLGGNTEAPSDFVMTDEPRPEGLTLWPAAPEWLPPQHAAAYDAFLNVHSHLVNLLRFLAGDPAIRFARIADPSSSTVEATVGAGVPCVFDLGARSNGEWTEGIEFRFDDATIAVELPPPFRRRAAATVRVQRKDVADAVHAPADPEWAFGRQARAFVADVRAGTTPRASGADALGDLRFAETAWRDTLQALVP